MNFGDLNTKGFVVVPNIIPKTDIDRLIDRYKVARSQFDKQGTHNANYNMLYAGPHMVSSKLAPVVDNINSSTNIDIDIIAGLGSFFDSSILTFGWHQDHEPYYMWQIASSYVNFWIPLIKPDRKKAGLRLVPFDTLKERTSQQVLDDKVLHRGAQNFRTRGKVTDVLDDNLGTQSVIDMSINDICVIPEVGPGDAIIMRGDLVHRSDDTVDHRVAISIKALNCRDRVVTKEKFFTNSLSKTQTINNNKADYAFHLRRFNNDNVDQFRLRELFPKAPIHYSLAK